MYSLAKRILDIFCALLLIILLSPGLILISILSIILQGRNPFFLQQRPGKNQKLFTFIKFRTMNSNKDGQGNLMLDEERLTVFGRFLRTSSLDELPQIINILKGDMSFIGPRPLLVKYLPLYNEKQRRRHKLRPGMTGWAQVNGRNTISWQEKFDLDVYYVDHVSLRLDVKIFWLTIKKVLQRRDINSPNVATMEPFRGNSVS